MSRLRRLLQARIAAWRAVGRGCEASPGCRFGPGARLRAGWHEGRPGRVRLGAGCEIQDGAILDAWGGDIALGESVFVGPYAVIYGHGGVVIGEQTLLSMHCRVLSSNHALPPPGVDIRSQPDVRQRTQIGRDVWLGAGVTVLAGVTIGDGCVVGAGAVVTGELPPYSIAVGVPARAVGARGGCSGDH